MLSTETHGDVTVVLTPAELVEDAAAEFLAETRGLVEAGLTKLVFQFARTDRIDGRGLTAVLDGRDAALAAGGAVSVAGLAGACEQAFRVTRLDRRFESFADLVPAVNAIR